MKCLLIMILALGITSSAWAQNQIREIKVSKTPAQRALRFDITTFDGLNELQFVLKDAIVAVRYIESAGGAGSVVILFLEGGAGKLEYRFIAGSKERARAFFEQFSEVMGK